MDSVPNLNAGKDKLMGRILVVLGVVGVLGGGYAAYAYFTYKPGKTACSHLGELGKSDADGAHAVIEHMVDYVESHLVYDNRPYRVSGDDDDARCNDALKAMEKVMIHGQFTRMVDCFAKATEARDALHCI